MKQIFHQYHLWECYKNGMWNKVSKDIENKLLPIAIEFTGNDLLYGNAMLKVIAEWKYSMENFLSNISINRKAYVGHCAVCYELKIPEYITRSAWGNLTELQQIKANLKAEYAIKKWEQNQKLKTTYWNGKENVIQKEYQTMLL